MHCENIVSGKYRSTSILINVFFKRFCTLSCSKCDHSVYFWGCLEAVGKRLVKAW